MKIKSLNRVKLLLILILVLTAFQACNKAEESQKPKAKNIIFMIGDGMGLHQLHAAMTVNKGTLAMMEISHVGLQKTGSANSYITDSGAAATAMACGVKTNNKMIGMTPDSVEQISILKILDSLGIATGLVATSSITHATPACFIANEISRYNYEAIAEDFLMTDIDLFIGGGMDNFNNRKDGRDLLVELEKKGYTIARNMTEVKNFKKGKLAGLTAPVHNLKMSEGRGDMLPLSTKKAIDVLNKSENGFFVMIEGSMIDWGGHDNDFEYVISEILDFDKAVKIALDFAKKDGETLVVITGDHETGGLMILNGDYASGEIDIRFNTTKHTGIMIPVYAYGPGAELFTGIYENTAFKNKFLEALDLQETE